MEGTYQSEEVLRDAPTATVPGRAGSANAEIIRRGYGHAYTRFPFRHLEGFRQLEREARTNRRGLWGTVVGGSADSSQAAPAGVPRTVYVTKTGTKYHLDGCRFLSKSRIPMPRDEAVQRYELCAVCAARLRSKR